MGTREQLIKDLTGCDPDYHVDNPTGLQFEVLETGQIHITHESGLDMRVSPGIGWKIVDDLATKIRKARKIKEELLRKEAEEERARVHGG